MSFFIGDLEIKKRVILAPMAGITSFSYRKFMNKFGCGLTYSEMISDCGLFYKNKATLDLLKTDGEDRPLGIQLFGGSKETLIKGIECLEKLKINYDVLDINLGCPVNKVIKNNGGSSWLKDPQKLYEMLAEIVKISPKPVSVKIRLGFNEINVFEILKVIEKAGVKFVTIHARTRNELYTGIPHIDLLTDLNKKINIPFAISGNIFTVEDALKALKITKANAIAVARGGIGNPELISNINKALNGEKYTEKRELSRQIIYLKEFSEELYKEYGEIKASKYLRNLAPRFFDTLIDSKKYKSLFINISTKEDFSKALKTII